HYTCERLERRIARAVLVDQRFDRAAALRILVRIRRSGSVETLRPEFLLRPRDLLRLDEEEFGLRIDEPADQPSRRGSVDSNAFARDPLHERPSRRCRMSPTIPAAMIKIGSGIFRALTSSTSVTRPIATVGMSMKA